MLYEVITLRPERVQPARRLGARHNDLRFHDAGHQQLGSWRRPTRRSPARLPARLPGEENGAAVAQDNGSNLCGCDSANLVMVLLQLV